MKRRLIKILLYTFGVITLLLLSSYLLLRSAPVQNFLIHKLSQYLSKELKTDVYVRGVNVNFRHLILEDVTINDLHRNPLIKIKNLEVNIRKIRRIKKELEIKNITLKNAYIAIIKYKGERNFNYQYLIDYFSNNQATKSKSEDNWKISCKSLDIAQSHFTYVDENDSGQQVPGIRQADS